MLRCLQNGSNIHACRDAYTHQNFQRPLSQTSFLKTPFSMQFSFGTIRTLHGLQPISYTHLKKKKLNAEQRYLLEALSVPLSVNTECLTSKNRVPISQDIKGQKGERQSTPCPRQDI